MQSIPPTIIIRHRLENLKKCSLRGLESRPDFIFVTYPYRELPNLNGYIILDLDAPPLTEFDKNAGILVVDATWRYAEKMMEPLKQIPNCLRRSLPGHYRTAYPRKQTACADPERGLASIEALYLTLLHAGRKTDGLLDNYYWKDQFLSINRLEGRSVN
jgi:pre-rRNA-processing protein TSR3